MDNSLKGIEALFSDNRKNHYQTFMVMICAMQILFVALLWVRTEDIKTSIVEMQVKAARDSAIISAAERHIMGAD